MFPGMEFRSAFAQLSGDGLALCAKPEGAKSRTRLAYLWAHRVPNIERPAVALAGEAHAPLGARSLLRLDVPEGARPKGLERVREWQLQPAREGAAVTVPVAVKGTALELDLTKVKAAPGEYTLAEVWDWERATVPGKICLHPFGDLKQAKLTAKSRGRLAEGNGTVTVTMEGADFQFLEKLAMEKAGRRQAAARRTALHAAQGQARRRAARARSRDRHQGLARGDYRFLLVQGDGLTYEVPFQVLPPNPQISNVPLRVNTGDEEIRLALEGTGLDRLEGLTSDAGQFELAPAAGATGRAVTFRLAPAAKKGERFAAADEDSGCGGTGGGARSASGGRSAPAHRGRTEVDFPAGDGGAAAGGDSRRCHRQLRALGRRTWKAPPR